MPRNRMTVMLNKVPEVTLFFWIIKVLCTTIGETAADYLNEQLHFGLTGTSVVMSVLLAVALVFQFQASRYRPALYWLVVALLSVVGTLITDNLTDGMKVSLVTSTLVFSGLLALTFLAWYRTEKTVSVHAITTSRREAFYWLTILFTFALGTAAGDLSAERLALGYLPSLGIFAGLIAVVAGLHFGFKKPVRLGSPAGAQESVTAFWAAYVLTRPLGASIGDYLSQNQASGGLGLGTTLTSAIFAIGILVLVTYLTISRKDEIRQAEMTT